MIISLIIAIIGIIGFILHRSHALLLLLTLELILLSVTLIFFISAISYDNSNGQFFGIIIIVIAGAESAIGLSILVAYYRLRGSNI